MVVRSAGLPVVALVGRPNVGKSTLFNRVVGDDRAAIVEDRARTTRDRLYGDAEWNGRRFVVVDTGGLEMSPGDPIEAQVQLQARLAINEADVIVFMVDAATGPTPGDQDASELLRRTTKPVLVAANKADNEKRELDAAEFYAFGWEETFAISANHGRGVGDLLDAIVWALPPESDAETARKAREAEAEAWADDMAAGRIEPFATGEDDEAADGDEADDGDEDEEPAQASDAAARWDAMMAAEDDEPPAIAFVGRPNVGKSSLLNSLLGETRTIVSDTPGTTRDAIDTTIPWGRSEVVLIDTAGIRKRGKVASGPAAERYSTLRALKAISRADVAVLVLDAADGLTAQDAHVAGYVIEEGKGLVIAVNKWDIVEDKTHKTFDEFSANLRRELAVHRLRPGRLDLGQDRPARAEGARARGRRVGRAAAADPDGRAQPARSPPRSSAPRRRWSADAARRSGTRPRPASPRRRSCSSRPTPRRSTSRTAGTSRTGSATRTASTGPRSGWCSGSRSARSGPGKRRVARSRRS